MLGTRFNAVFSRLGALALLLALTAAGVACSTAPTGVLVSVRDKTSLAPVGGPVVTVSPVGSMLTEGSPESSKRGNDFGVARFELITAPGAKYFVIVDAEGYDLQTAELPSMGPLFPSGKWLDTESGRIHPLKANQRLQVMVSIEPE